MKANELRIGNKVISFDKDWKEIIATIELVYDAHYCVKEHSSAMTFNNIKPIPLTPEILGKAGFETYEYEDWKNKRFFKDKYILTLYKNGRCMYCVKADGNVKIADIFHLHQLQNLYFALTGEELQIRL